MAKHTLKSQTVAVAKRRQKKGEPSLQRHWQLVILETRARAEGFGIAVGALVGAVNALVYLFTGRTLWLFIGFSISFAVGYAAYGLQVWRELPAARDRFWERVGEVDYEEEVPVRVSMEDEVLDVNGQAALRRIRPDKQVGPVRIRGSQLDGLLANLKAGAKDVRRDSNSERPGTDKLDPPIVSTAYTEFIKALRGEGLLDPTSRWTQRGELFLHREVDEFTV